MDSAYWLLLPILVNVALGTHVLLQAPKRWLNRFFALYALSLVVASTGLLIMSTTDSAPLATAALLTTLIMENALGGTVLLATVLARFFRRALFRWYVLPPLLGIAAVFVVILLVDGFFHTNLVFVPVPELGRGYVDMKAVQPGPGGAALRIWFMLTSTVTVLLMIVAWIRNRSGERIPAAMIAAGLVIAAATQPLLPQTPAAGVVPALAITVVLGIVVVRYRLLLSTQVAMDAVFRSAH
jgi:hypothetical protein